jgi:hypothetical protein
MADTIESLESEKKYELERIAVLKKEIESSLAIIANHEEKIKNLRDNTPKVGEVWWPGEIRQNGIFAVIMPGPGSNGLQYFCFHWDDPTTHPVGNITKNGWVKFANNIGEAMYKIRQDKLTFKKDYSGNYHSFDAK